MIKMQPALLAVLIVAISDRATANLNLNGRTTELPASLDDVIDQCKTNAYDECNIYHGFYSSYPICWDYFYRLCFAPYLQAVQDWNRDMTSLICEEEEREENVCFVDGNGVVQQCVPVQYAVVVCYDY